ncbi:MAG: hypothetical protein R6U26_01800 [Candidatus Undinarchaeales archaeon]
MAKKKKKSKKTSRKKSKSKRKKHYLLKSKHLSHISKFVKHLHTLGVDVSKHTDSLKFEEEQLERLEQEEKSFISKKDAEKLDEVLHNLMSASERLLKIEAVLYRHTKPLVEKAFGMAAPLPVKLTTLAGLKSIFKGSISGSLEDARNHVLASFANEKILFDECPELLDEIELGVKELTKLEKKWKGKGGQARLDMTRMHMIVRKMIHEDVYNLSEEIYELYNLRLEAYEYLIEKDKENDERKIPGLEQEYYKIASIQSDYLKKFNKHMKNLQNIYGGGK